MATPDSVAELDEVLREFARREVATIVIDGGDGTVRDVLTALIDAYGSDLPDLAIAPSGNTNLVVRSTGGIPRGPGGLERLARGVAGEVPVRITRRVALDVRWLGQPGRVVRGMVFGAAAFTDGAAIANERLRRLGVRNRAAVAMAIAGTAGRAMFASGRRALLGGQPMTMAVDRGEASEGRRFLVLATPLDRLTLGFWPFAETGDGPIHWLDLKAPPHGLFSIFLRSFGSGLPSRLLVDRGHGSGRAHEITMSLASPFVVDGDRFEAGEGGVRLSSSPPLRFLSA